MNEKTIDVDKLAAMLADLLGVIRLDLIPVDVQCAWPVFKGEACGRGLVFVKLTSKVAALRTVALIEAAKSCDLLPRLEIDGVPEFGRYSVLCLEWRDVVRVDAEDMNDAQRQSFLEGCQILSGVLAEAPDISPVAEEDLPETQYAVLQAYACRHAFVSRFMGQMLKIPEMERNYKGRRLVPIHGDLQSRNYGFKGDRMAAVFDFDDITWGLACEDMAYAFTERVRRSKLSRAQRTMLIDQFVALARQSPWPRDEWLVAVNHARLRIATRRLAKRPDSLLVAFDILKRDRPLRMLADAMKDWHA